MWYYTSKNKIVADLHATADLKRIIFKPFSIYYINPVVLETVFMYIPFSPPDMTEAEANELKETVRSGLITTGPQTTEFEQAISDYCQTSKTVCFNSATAALELTLRMLGVGEGDEVIVPAYTYTASCSVICHVGATPVMVDTAKDSLEMDYDLMEAAINDKTKVIIPVDIAGIICNYDRIYKCIENKRSMFKPSTDIQRLFGRIIVLADCAHGFGAERNGKRAGCHADFTCFSFHAVKNLTTAEGGAVTWQSVDGIDDEELYSHFRFMSLHGQTKSTLSKNKPGLWEYDVIAPYYKCNMTDLTAAIGVAQFRRYPEMLKRRTEIIDKYNKAFANLDVNVLDHKSESHCSSGHLYMVRVNGINENQRNSIIEKMAEKQIACNVHYKPLPLLTAYKNLGFKMEDYPNAYDHYINEITLPLYSKLTDEQVDYIINVFSELVKEAQC